MVLAARYTKCEMGRAGKRGVDEGAREGMAGAPRTPQAGRSPPLPARPSAQRSVNALIRGFEWGFVAAVWGLSAAANEHPLSGVGLIEVSTRLGASQLQPNEAKS